MITYNLDKFTNGTIKLLFIFGYSGSGKSTLARSLANEYKCKIKVMEIRSVENCYKELKNILINTSTRSDKNQYIIEGVQLLPIYEIERSFFKHELWNHAFIILDTDIKTSVIRRLKREFNNTKIITKHWIKSQVTGFIDGFIDMISCIFHTINIFHLYNRYTYDKKVLDTIKYIYHIRNNYINIESKTEI